MKELVHFDGGNVTFSMGVAMVAEALSPFAAARHIVAEIGACIVEINQIDLERKKLQAVNEQLSANLEIRQRNVVLVFQHSLRKAQQADVTLSALEKGFHAMVQKSTDRYISEDERLIATNLIPTLGGQLLAFHQAEIVETVNLAKALHLGAPLQIVDRWGL